VLCCLAVLLLPAPSRTAAYGLAEVSGTVVGFDSSSQLLTVNTRFGVRRFLLNSSTLVLLNNRTAQANNIQAGDDVDVEYRYPEAVAVTVHLHREEKRSGRVTSVSGGTISLLLPRGAVLNLRPDAQTHFTIEGIPITEQTLLVNRNATALYEPGIFNLLSLAARTPGVMNGTIAAVDAAARTVTLRGKPRPVLAVHASAAILRNGKAVALGSLQPGDRVRVAFVGKDAKRRVLALRATGK
jgi:hypothetical protein